MSERRNRRCPPGVTQWRHFAFVGPLAERLFVDTYEGGGRPDAQFLVAAPRHKL